MHNIRRHLLPAFTVGYGVTALIHLVGILLLRRVKFQPVNQRIVITHLAFTEFFTNSFQVLVYTLLIVGQCEPNSICDSVDYLIYLFVMGTNKLIMVYLIFDRLLDIQLHLKYPLYFTKSRVKKIMLSFWIISGILATVIFLFKILKIGSRKWIGTAAYCYIIFTDIVIVLTALITYSFLYVKVRRFHSMDESQKGMRKGSKSSYKSKFLLPCLIIATYLMFNTTGDILVTVSRYFILKDQTWLKAIISEIAHWLWILGWSSDGILYIFMQKSIKQRLRSISLSRRSSVAPIHSVTVPLQFITRTRRIGRKTPPLIAEGAFTV